MIILKIGRTVRGQYQARTETFHAIKTTYETKNVWGGEKNFTDQKYSSFIHKQYNQ